MLDQLALRIRPARKQHIHSAPFAPARQHIQYRCPGHICNCGIVHKVRSNTAPLSAQITSMQIHYTKTTSSCQVLLMFLFANFSHGRTEENCPITCLAVEAIPRARYDTLRILYYSSFFIHCLFYYNWIGYCRDLLQLKL